MKERHVIAEFVDVETDKRYLPGETFTPHDENQERRLTGSLCLGEAVPEKVKPEAKVAAETKKAGTKNQTA